MLGESIGKRYLGAREWGGAVEASGYPFIGSGDGGGRGGGVSDVAAGRRVGEHDGRVDGSHRRGCVELGAVVNGVGDLIADETIRYWLAAKALEGGGRAVAAVVMKIRRGSEGRRGRALKWLRCGSA